MYLYMYMYDTYIYIYICKMHNNMPSTYKVFNKF